MPKSVTTSARRRGRGRRRGRARSARRCRPLAVGKEARHAAAACRSSSSRSSSSFEPALEHAAAADGEDVAAHVAASVDSRADALRLRLRPGLRRGRARAARRQGDRARGDDGARRPRPGGLHDHHRRVPRVHDVERRAARRARGRGCRAHRLARGRRRASGSATRTTRCSSPFARAPQSRCPG